MYQSFHVPDRMPEPGDAYMVAKPFVTSAGCNYASQIAMRGTGRTERMLRHAEELAREGRAVYVFSATAQGAKHLEERFGVAQAQALGVKFESLPKSFFQDDGRIRGRHPNCVFLVDHYAIELHYAKQFEMLHRYDSPTRVLNP